jgi:hypothetical protein
MVLSNHFWNFCLFSCGILLAQFDRRTVTIQAAGRQTTLGRDAAAKVLVTQSEGNGRQQDARHSSPL